MTQGNEPNDFRREIERQMRSLNRRVQRLEYSQIAPQEFNDSLNRIYDEIDALEEQMNQRFDRLERKIDVIMRHITGIDDPNS